MLIKEYKALFIHVPKAAGQSVENYFLNSLSKTRDEDGAKYLLKFNHDPSKGPERLAHLTAPDYLNYNYISKANFEDYFKFAVVRNPWSRMVSFYKFRGYSSIITFENFIHHYLPYCFEKQHWFFRPQTDFICDDNQKFLTDYIAKMEQLDKDFPVIAKKLNLANEILPKSNHSIERGFASRKSLNIIKEHPSILKYLSFNNKIYNYKDAYSESSLKIVASYYEKDIDLLKYAY
ncbi:MAG: hypothetical protein ACI9SJ_000536 [Flavobacteriaceae bacterium]|jgi:hypothetical protein|uniref:sulfotransferase family 2 domain-containing protein n=1 Tax=Candidatus Marifrigoribacter sp. Uisw_064 TaxID=3230970 RepID=UPI003ADC2A6D